MIGERFIGFLSLAPQSAAPSPPDRALSFTRESIGAAGGGEPAALTAFSPNGSAGAAIFATDARGVRRIDAPGPAFSPADFSPAPSSAASVVPVDWNRDYLMDLAIAGRGGIRDSMYSRSVWLTRGWDVGVSRAYHNHTAAQMRPNTALT